MRILLVEDDSMIGQGLQRGLQREGHVVDWVRDGQAAGAALMLAAYAVLLLDLGLPGHDGMRVLEDARRRHDQLPVIIITARDALADRLAGLDSGADDYLVKPFALEELSARIRAVVRRHAGRGQPLFEVGPLRLDPVRHRLWLRGEPMEVSAKEFALLELLMRVPGTVLGREQIEAQLYGWDDEVGSNTVEVRIHNLRKKLGPEVIQTVRGVGYRIRQSE